MFCMNRFTGEIVHLISEDLRPRLLDIMTGKDVEYFIVDEAIAPILQNLIKKGVITHYSCSGHYNDLSIPYLVLDRWGKQNLLNMSGDVLIQIVNFVNCTQNM